MSVYDGDINDISKDTLADDAAKAKAAIRDSIKPDPQDVEDGQRLMAHLKQLFSDPQDPQDAEDGRKAMAILHSLFQDPQDPQDAADGKAFMDGLKKLVDENSDPQDEADGEAFKAGLKKLVDDFGSDITPVDPSTVVDTSVLTGPLSNLKSFLIKKQQDNERQQ